MNAEIKIFPWNDNLATGLPEIDVQHKKLVDLLNRLAHAFVYKVGTPEMESVFQELTDYAIYHFQTEEEIWNHHLAGDSWEMGHKKTHEKFVSDLLRLKEKKDRVPINDVYEEVLSFLTHWLAFHILDSDKRLAKVVLAKQIGMPLDEAKMQAQDEMSNSVQTLIETVLAMFDVISKRSLQLMREVVERVEAEDKANALLKRNQLMMQSTQEGVHILDEHGKVVEANEAFCRHLGYTQKEVMSLSVFDFDAKFPADELRSNVEALSKGGHAHIESIHRRKNGSLIDVEIIANGIELDGIKCIFALSRDISERKHAEQAIRELAFHDALTQLPNRRLFFDRLNQAVAASRRTSRYGALIFLDMDNFKPLNDQYGHDLGDALLIEVAHRISTSVRKMDTVARFGGDEFAVILGALSEDQPKSREQAFIVAEKIRVALASPYILARAFPGSSERSEKSEIEHECASSIGVVMFDSHADCLDELVKFADIAMYRAKSTGGNSVHFYDL